MEVDRSSIRRVAHKKISQLIETVKEGRSIRGASRTGSETIRLLPDRGDKISIMHKEMLILWNPFLTCGLPKSEKNVGVLTTAKENLGQKFTSLKVNTEVSDPDIGDRFHSIDQIYNMSKQIKETEQEPVKPAVAGTHGKS